MREARDPNASMKGEVGGRERQGHRRRLLQQNVPEGKVDDEEILRRI